MIVVFSTQQSTFTNVTVYAYLNSKMKLSN